MQITLTNDLIRQAIDLGFDFEIFTPETELDEITNTIIDYFNDNIDELERIEDECEVTQHSRGQHVEYGDYSSSGDIVDFSSVFCLPAYTKHFHSDFLILENGIFKHIFLYFFVPENAFNAPDGYYFSTETLQHEKII